MAAVSIDGVAASVLQAAADSTHDSQAASAAAAASIVTLTRAPRDHTAQICTLSEPSFPE